MKKILLFSIVFVAASISASAQKKISKETTLSQKKTVITVNSSGSGQAKAMVLKNPKQMNLQKSAAQPALTPAELKYERLN